MTTIVICDMLAALMKGRRTANELADMCVGGPSSQTGAMQALREAGLVRVCDFARGPRRIDGRPSERLFEVFELQTAPFALPDVRRPPASQEQLRKRRQAIAGRAHAVDNLQAVAA